MNAEQLLDLFTHKGVLETKKWFKNPFLQHGHVWATNGEAIIKVPESKSETKYDDGGAPDMYKKLPYTLLKDHILISTERIKELLDKCPRNYDRKVCVDCNGEETVLCDHCNHRNVCESCGGEGDVPDPTKPTVLLYDQDYIVVNKAHFNPPLLEKLYKVAVAKGVENIITISASNETSCHWFQIEDIVVGIMPVLMNGYDGSLTIHEY